MSSIPNSSSTNLPNKKKPKIHVTQKTNNTRFPNSTNQLKKKKQKLDLTPKTNKTQLPNWLDLIEDIWILIFSKLLTIELIENVQKVCMLFRKICKLPATFKTINMTLPRGHGRRYVNCPRSINNLTRYAIHKSAGGLIDINLGHLHGYSYHDIADTIFTSVTLTCKNLKHLRLGYVTNSTFDEKLIEVVKKLPMLEEVQIIQCSFSIETVEGIGHACPSLISFGLNGLGCKLPDSMLNDAYYMLNDAYYKLNDAYYKFNIQDFVRNDKALAISKSMPKLRHLQLIGNDMNNEGLKAILDGCPHLKSLDLRACFYIDLSADMGKRLANVQIRYPDDSTEDYGHESYYIYDHDFIDFFWCYTSLYDDDRVLFDDIGAINNKQVADHLIGRGYPYDSTNLPD